MKQFLFKFLVLILICFLGGIVYVLAQLSYGSGYYTNLCGSGFEATFYSCPADCKPHTGECRGSYVFKFTCNGKLGECRENLQGPTSYQKVDSPHPGCGKTVQLDVFRKNCLEGGWSCGENDLLGYMVWYSGDCRPPTVITKPAVVTL